MGSVIGTVLGTGDGVENKTEVTCSLETLRGHDREMIGCHENTQEAWRGVTTTY